MQEGTVEVLKIRFNKVTLKEATEKALDLAKGKKQSYITTPNPEFLLESLKNPEFANVLNNSDLNIPDGTGILWATKYLEIIKKNKSKSIKITKWLYSLLISLFYPRYIRSILKERVAGIDLMENICKYSPQNNLKIYLLGAKEGTAEKVKEILEKKYPGIKIVGTFSGSPHLEEEKDITNRINTSKAQVLFVAYGAPKQELWIAKNLPKMPEVKLAIGIGGSFNFIAGILKRAPKIMQKLGIEWLYRLFQEPSRAKRIYNATIKFAFTVLKTSI
ncbi:MAG: WecB/TagA/CpsF family glycosyltransferase [Candidatus Gracilibacteria bacterium]